MYNCSLCSKYFSRCDARRRHLQTVHMTCPLCMTKFEPGESTHVCQQKPKRLYLNKETLVSSGEITQRGKGVNEDRSLTDTDSESEADRSLKNRDNSESEEDGPFKDNDSESGECNSAEEECTQNETSKLCALGLSADEPTDIFAEDDENMESDASITSSEEDEEADVDDSEKDEDTKECRSDTIFLDWPNEDLYLKSCWHKYGTGKFKIIKHCDWLNYFTFLNDAETLRTVRRSSKSEFEALCEIARNTLLGNVYTRRVNKTFLHKNKNLIRALANSNISIERKRSHVVNRGASFVRGLVELVYPLISTLHGDVEMYE